MGSISSKKKEKYYNLFLIDQDDTDLFLDPKTTKSCDEKQEKKAFYQIASDNLTVKKRIKIPKSNQHYYYLPISQWSKVCSILKKYSIGYSMEGEDLTDGFSYIAKDKNGILIMLDHKVYNILNKHPRLTLELCRLIYLGNNWRDC